MADRQKDDKIITIFILLLAVAILLLGIWKEYLQFAALLKYLKG